MLVLGRRETESIICDGPAVITVIEIRADKVRLGITATDGTKVWRDEIWCDATGKPLPDGIDPKRLQALKLAGLDHKPTTV